MVNDLLMNLHGLAPLCIPINKTGKQAKDFPKMVEAGFASDDQLIMFPAGLLPRPLAVIGRIFPAAWGFRLLTGDGSVCSSLFPLAVIFAVCAAICVLALRRLQSE